MFNKVHAYAALATWLLLFPAQVDAKKNVLFIVADDLNCSISPYGDTGAHTPNLQRLADRGLTFKRAYCQQAVCNPSRSSFLTGLRPDDIGVDDLRKSFRQATPGGAKLITLPQHFKNHGYFCQNIGKMFHNMGETQDRRSWSIDEVLYKGTHANDTVFANTPWHGGKRPYKAPVTEAFDVTDTAYRDGHIANLAAAMLRDHSKSQPFFLAVGFWRPHLPFVAPKKYWDLYDPSEIAKPTPALPPANAPAIALHESREIRGYGLVPKARFQSEGQGPYRQFTASEVQHYRQGYYASISFLDAQLGEILDALRSSGHADNTLVIFTSDHGFHIGEHSLWGKTTNFELDARVPLIVADPSLQQHGASTDAIVELVDLFPSMADLADIADDLPTTLGGVSFKPVITGEVSTIKDCAFTQHQQPFYGDRSNWKAWGYSVRTTDYRYTQWRSIKDQQPIAEELYDHRTDPGESVNVAADSHYSATLENLKRKIANQFPGIVAAPRSLDD